MYLYVYTTFIYLVRIFAVGEGGDIRSSAQSNAIDSVIQQILAGTSDLDKEGDLETKKRDLNKVTAFTLY